MTRDEPSSRFSSVTSASSESSAGNASDITVKPLPALPKAKERNKDNAHADDASSRQRSSSRGSRRAAAPSKLKTDEHRSVFK